MEVGVVPVETDMDGYPNNLIEQTGGPSETNRRVVFKVTGEIKER